MLTEKRQQLLALYQKESATLSTLLEVNAPQDEINRSAQAAKTRIVALQAEIESAQEEWKKACENTSDGEVEALWHQPDTSVGQLVIDYGEAEYVYVMPPEIAGLKIHVSSQLSVPKALWGQLLEYVLAGYGVGVKQIGPFLRQLSFLRLNGSGLVAITDSQEELQLFPDDVKAAYILTPTPGDLRRVLQFLEKISPQEQIVIQQLSGSILIIGLVREIQELLKVATFISTPKLTTSWAIVTLQKGNAEEMSKMLATVFDADTSKIEGGAPGHGEKPSAIFGGDPSHSLRVIPLKHPSQSLFLIGNREYIEKAQKLITEVEATIGDTQEKEVFWYACKHSEAEDLSKVLSQVYIQLLEMRGDKTKPGLKPEAYSGPQFVPIAPSSQYIEVSPFSSPQVPPSTIVQAPPLITPGSQDKNKQSQATANFIVDSKTNSIVMVVEGYLLPRLKELTRKLDVPKQMVQIDVLLVEKKLNDSSSFGMNLLRLGSSASKKHKDSLAWNDFTSNKKKLKKGGNSVKGVLQYAISRNPASFMPFDLVYQFLLTQENIQINANPSVTTVNQTPAKIAVVDQISINMGAVALDGDKVTDAYTRAEYGITIQITPTVYSKAVGDEGDPNDQKFITLATDIIFDTTKPDKNDRPQVTRRNVKNEVRVADGETVIIGGLRRKVESGDQESIPFLGELPGIGKFFSSTILTSTTTEMFVFITPRIVPNSHEELERTRNEELKRRPGDVPEFLQEIEAAKAEYKRYLFERSIQLLFKSPE